MFKPFLILLSALSLASVALAADPTGTWTWTNPGRHGHHGQPTVLTLQLANGQLTGSVQTRNSQTAIADASFANDVVTFTVTRDFGDQSFTVKYSGKVEGDTITGTVEMPNRDGDTVTHKWKAKREKSPPPAPAQS